VGKESGKKTKPPKERRASLCEIKMLVLDVDGVMTDGRLVINADGSETKFFNALDGHGIRMWRRAGLQVALLSGRLSPPTKHQAKLIEADYCLEECHNKLAALKGLLKDVGLSPRQIAYVGDDLPDLPAIRYAGFGAAVANAVDEVKRYADYVTSRTGGDGAVREVIEHILKAAGRWDELVKRYLPDSAGDAGEDANQ
jgi:3-deoxy-D-manno-octulosonate 8-phosphate phosphatase (KDO 8-P phosphatase)